MSAQAVSPPTHIIAPIDLDDLMHLANSKFASEDIDGELLELLAGGD